MSAAEPHTNSGSTAAAISNAIVRITADYTGRGPNKARTVMARDTVSVVLQDALTKAEQRLAERGESDFVLQTRHKFQHAMRDDMVNAVQELTGRKVVAFMSDSHIEPDMAVEFFVLEPTADNDRTITEG